MIPKYKFELEVGSTKKEVFPIYKDDLAKDYELESNEQFYRIKLSGKITLLNEDYAFVMGKPFDTIFILNVYQSVDFGNTYDMYCKAKFTKTDCEIDYNNKKITINPQIYDDYNDILSGLEKEFNLIELAPKIERLTVLKRPLIQIYVAGDNVLSNVIGGVYWEQDVNEPTTDENLILTKYHFSRVVTKYRLLITGGTGLSEGANGEYVGNEERLDQENIGNYALIYYEFSQQSGTYTMRRTNGYNLVTKNNPDSILWQFEQSVERGQNDPDFEEYLPIPDSFVLNPYQGTVGLVPLNANRSDVNVYYRWLTNSLSIGGEPTKELAVDDIVSYNRNYKRAVGLRHGFLLSSSKTQDEPTEWGIDTRGKYFIRPSENSYPIARSTWINVSFWFLPNSFVEELEPSGISEFVLKDTFPVSSVISVLLKEIAPNISHEATPEYSQFLYSDENPIIQLKYTLLVAPKSNLLAGEYTTPALTAKTTLNEFLNMLKKTYKLYWYVEDGKLKIEHIKFFHNGGTYDVNPIIGIDLTKLINIRNGKVWEYGTQKVTFDKQNLPERYQFEWMDDVTQGFYGFPIEVKSNYVEQGKIENINVGNFTSDVDYMLLNPNSISQDGFCLFAASGDPGAYKLDIGIVDVNGKEYKMQNYLASFLLIAKTFYLYDLPSRNVIINNSVNYARMIIRGQQQQLKFPVTTHFEPLQLVKTSLGNAKFQKISINLSSQMINATLNYETDLQQ